MNLSKAASTTLIIAAIVAVLYLGKPLLIPFVLAIIFWFLIKEVRMLMDKIAFVERTVPRWMKTTFSALVIFLVLALIGKLLRNNIGQLSQSMPVYEQNVEHIIARVNAALDIDVQEIFLNYFENFNFTSILQKLFDGLSGLVGNAFLIVIYVLFLLIEESAFGLKLKAFHSSEEGHEHAKVILKRVETSMGRYLALKTSVSLLTGFLSFWAFYFIGVDAPLFWAFLIFLLNYIPTVGSLIGTVIPAIFTLLQFGQFLEGSLVLVIVGAIQVVVGNIIEPKMMGNSLNISSLVVILSLSFWGFLWDVTGMILSVPIMVMLIIIFSEFKSTKPIAVMLSEKGNV